jgi:hypothetical protein
MLLYNLAELDCIRKDGRHADALLDQAEAALRKSGAHLPMMSVGIFSVRAEAADLRNDPDIAEQMLLDGLALARRSAPHMEGHLANLLAKHYDREGKSNLTRALRNSSNT